MATISALSQERFNAGEHFSPEFIIPDGAWKSLSLVAKISDGELLDVRQSARVRVEWFNAQRGTWDLIVGFKWVGGQLGSPSTIIDSWITRELVGKRVRAVLKLERSLNIGIDFAPDTAEFIRNVENLENSPTIYGTITEGTADNTTEWSFSHVVGAASNRYLHVGIGYNTGTISGITFNTSETVTERVPEDGTGGGVDAIAAGWRLVAPTVTTADVVITMSASQRINAGVTDYQDVD